jgi:Matrixin
VGARSLVASLPFCGVAIAAMAGCFLGYDSNWGAAKRAQRHLAEAGPTIIESRDEPLAAAAPTKRTWHVRFRPNDAYLTQTVDAPKQLADLMDDATAVLEPALGLRLELQSLSPWTMALDDDLHGALDALVSTERADDVDLVVGLVGALPHQTDSLHEAGLANLLGRHIVLRAASRYGEYDNIERTFDQLSADERAKILKQRKRHRALAVFLHELGHCLGALHDSDPKSVMSWKYSPKVSEFGVGALALMRVGLDGGDKKSVARGQLQVLERPTGDSEWIPVERDAEIAALRAFIDPPRSTMPPVAPAARAPASVTEESLAELRAEDRARLSHALSLFQAGAVAAAYQSAMPLFALYPKSLVVQDLRCQLATVRWLPRKELQAECSHADALRAKVDAGR